MCLLESRSELPRDLRDASAYLPRSSRHGHWRARKCIPLRLSPELCMGLRLQSNKVNVLGTRALMSLKRSSLPLSESTFRVCWLFFYFCGFIQNSDSVHFQVTFRSLLRLVLLSLSKTFSHASSFSSLPAYFLPGLTCFIAQRLIRF